MKKFTGLARISSVTQLAKGNSLKDQATSITEYAKKIGGEVEEISQIQCSGKKMTLSSSILSKILLDAKMKKREVILQGERSILCEAKLMNSSNHFKLS